MLITVRVTSSHHLTRLTPPPRLSGREQQSPLHLPREERGPHQRGVTSFVSVSGVGKKLRCNESRGKNLTFHRHPLLSIGCQNPPRRGRQPYVVKSRTGFPAEEKV